MKEIVLERNIFSDYSTIGDLFGPDGERWSYTLEDTVRNHKVAKKTAIPAGRYEVIVAWSPHFQKPMPRLIDVPLYQGILIHNGNIPEQTDGCILVGRTKAVDFIGESKLAFAEIFPKIKALTDEGQLFITIHGGRTYDEWVRL